MPGGPGPRHCPPGGSDCSSGRGKAPLCNNSLHALQARNADVELVFEAADGRTETLPAHSQLLTCWSGVIANALEAADAGGGSPRAAAAAAARRSVPMPGTSRADWLVVAQFMYPVVPPPAVSWETCEVLLVLGAKLDMPALLARAAAFVQDNMPHLDMAEGSRRFVWTWLRLTDAAGLDDVCAHCIRRAVQLDPSSCAVEARLQGLSPRALQRLVLALAAVAGGLPSTGNSPRSSFTGSTPRASASYRPAPYGGGGGGGGGAAHEAASLLDSPLP